MPPNRPHKKLHHYNTPGHAHELTFSCFRRQRYFDDDVACRYFLTELEKARVLYNFKLWAYVLMPHHVHLLIWPLNHDYDIGKIGSGIKGVMAKKYRKYLLGNDPSRHDSFLMPKEGVKHFIFWQKGGGFDRNMWNPKAIHDSVIYIEANPVWSGLAGTPEEWPWSSAYARANKEGVIPDTFSMPVTLSNPRHQRLGIL